MYNILMQKKSIVCYTCITGDYDHLKQPIVFNRQIDYVCFTDCARVLPNSIWQFRPIPKELCVLSQVKQQRIVKICPHRYLREYSISIWIDGSFQICGSLVDFVRQYDLSKTPLYTRVHPQRNCIYEEAKVCIAMHKDSRAVIDKQIAKYQEEGYPKNAGMYETGVILRKHNDMKCQLVCNRWASELLLGSHRDQLSFNYACWKEHFLPGCLNGEFNLCGNMVNTFRLCRHGRH